jgi:hypothetical protein
MWPPLVQSICMHPIAHIESIKILHKSSPGKDYVVLRTTRIEAGTVGFRPNVTLGVSCAYFRAWQDKCEYST